MNTNLKNQADDFLLPAIFNPVSLSTNGRWIASNVYIPFDASSSIMKLNASRALEIIWAAGKKPDKRSYRENVLLRCLAQETHILYKPEWPHGYKGMFNVFVEPIDIAEFFFNFDVYNLNDLNDEKFRSVKRSFQKYHPTYQNIDHTAPYARNPEFNKHDQDVKILENAAEVFRTDQDSDTEALYFTPSGQYIRATGKDLDRFYVLSRDEAISMYINMIEPKKAYRFFGASCVSASKRQPDSSDPSSEAPGM